jgi:hypothetical protein
MNSAPQAPNLREGESALVVVCPVCAAPRGVKCAGERHALDGVTHNERIAAAAAWHTLNAAARRAEGRRTGATAPALLHEASAKSAMRAERVEALAEEWEGFARRIQLDFGRFPPEERSVQEARAQVWLAAAYDMRRTMAEGEASECPRCGRTVLAPATLAAQAGALRGAIEGAVALGLTRPGDALAEAYGGDTRRALLAALNRAADLALEHACASACAAGTCTRKGTA